MRFVVALALIGCSPDEGTDKPTDPADECVAEVPYDGIDQDCDGGDLVDVDDDGHDAVSTGGSDCDDEDGTVHPGATEVPYDGIDQDCADGDLLDADGDGDLPLTEGGTDCDDDDALTHPGAPDTVGNGIDNDCDGVDGLDADQDGYASKDSGGNDCDDADLDVNPDATEVWYDGLDQNCDRICDFDQDNDGAVAPGYPITNGSPCDAAPGPEVWAPEDCNELDPAVNDVAMSRTDPENLATGIGTDITVVATLSEVDPAPTLAVFDTSTGLEVPGSFTVGGGQSLAWEPNAPLTSGTGYRADVTHGCGTESFSFTTAYEAVVLDPASLVGRAWSLDLTQGDWVEPENVGDLFAGFLQTNLMVEVVAAGADSLDVRLASQAAAQQDLCTPTADTSADFSANPELVTSPVDWPISSSGIPTSLLGATLEAGVRADGAVLVDATVTAELDTRSLIDLINPGGAPDDICNLIGALGVSCRECTDGGGPYCLDVRVEDLVGVETEGPIVPRTQEDVDADPACP